MPKLKVQIKSKVPMSNLLNTPVLRGERGLSLHFEI
jgi:hypothetical protein